MDGGMSIRATRREESRMRSSPTASTEVPLVESCPEDLQCQICLSAASDPVVTEECGHLFCKECIDQAMERKKECPVDRLPLTAADLRKDIRTQRKISSLVTYCYHRKGGCQWTGQYSDLEKHAEKCENATVRCPFAQHGCEVATSRKTLPEHLTSNVSAHLLLMCSALAKVSEENLVLQQEVELLQREDMRFVWAIPSFESKKSPLYSRKFWMKGLAWYIGVDFDGPDEHAGVYLFAEGHTKRVDFKLTLFNQDSTRDKVHMVNDWAVDYRGKGWGPLKFIDRTTVHDGYLVSGCVRIGVEIEGDAFD